MLFTKRSVAYGHRRCCFTPIDRNQRVRILLRAEAIERQTKAKGRQAGALAQSGLRVLRCLLFQFANCATGRCDPGYRAICRATGFCRQTVSNALKRLEAAELIEITRRMVRAGRRAVQTTNAYAFREPQAVLLHRSEPPKVKESERARSMPEMPESLKGALERLAHKLGFTMPAETAA